MSNSLLIIEKKECGSVDADYRKDKIYGPAARLDKLIESPGEARAHRCMHGHEP